MKVALLLVYLLTIASVAPIRSAPVEVLKALEDADATLEIPEGENIAIIAPNDDAFNAIIAELELSGGKGLNDTELLTGLANYHIATFTDANASELTALNGATIPVLDYAGKPSTIAKVAAGKGKVQGVSNTVSITEVTACPGGKINIWLADAVLLPPAAGSELADEFRPAAFDAATTAAGPVAAPVDAPGPSIVSTAFEVGDVINSTCPDIMNKLTGPEHTVNLAILSALEAADISLNIDPKADIVIIAPVDDAHNKIINELDISGGKGLNDTELLSAFAKYHLTTYTDPNASVLTALNGATIPVLDAAGKPSTIAAVTAAGKGEVKGVVNTANVIETASCPNGRVNLWVIDAVPEPPAADSELADEFRPAAFKENDAATTAPAPASSPEASSSTNIGAIVGGVVGGIAVLAAIAAFIIWRKRRNSTAPPPTTPPPFTETPVSMQKGPTRPEDSAALTHSLSSLPSLSASADPVLQWIATNTAGTPVISRKSSQRSIPSNMKSLAFTWPEVRVLKPLGLGSFGKVYLGTLNHTPVAFKLLIDARAAAAATNASAVQSAESGFEGAPAVASYDALVSEASILASVRHPNVALLVGYCLNPPCLALEYASRGSLFDVLKKAAADPAAAAELTWQRRLGMAADAAAGMLHLHTRSPPILHRDLKSPNLLVTAEWTVKVTDMGLSKVASEASRNASATNGPGNNPRWLAPEVLDGARATEASDVFSFGVVLWEILTWRLPWNDVNVWTIVGGVMRGARPEVPPLDQLPGERADGAALEAYMGLMRQCWAQNSEDRPTFEAVASELRAFVL